MRVMFKPSHSTNARLGEVMVEKTLQQEKIDLLNGLIELIGSATMSHDIYGTTKEDAYISGINEGISRAVDLIKQELELIKPHG